MSAISQVALAAVDAPRPRVEPSPWRPLQYFTIYRILLATVMLVLMLTGQTPRVAGPMDVDLFRQATVAYLVFSGVAAIAAFTRRPQLDVQIVLPVIVDIAALTIMLHASGGVTGGFGILLLVAVAGGSILAQGRMALVFAALASLAVLGQQLYIASEFGSRLTNYPYAGLLGATLFVTAFLAYSSARRIRASEALAARREVDIANLAQLNEHIIARMQSGILVVDATETIRLMNQSARELLGVGDELRSEKIRSALPELGQLLDVWKADSLISSHLVRPRANEIDLVASFAAVGEAAGGGILVFLEDNSALLQRAQQLKLASLGRLAASIAHEIRNPLSAVNHAAQLLAEAPTLDSSDVRLIHIIQANSKRMNEIVENVLALGRGKPAEPQSVVLLSWLNEFAAEIRSHLGMSEDRVECSVEPQTLRVKVDPVQLRQIVWNLCENAMQHAGAAGIISLCGRVSEQTMRPYLEVRDNGPGIAPDVQEHLFEPFFTTRSGGTGLGLYIGKELCEGNKATLNHMPTEEGCCFRVSFPDPRRQSVIHP